MKNIPLNSCAMRPRKNDHPGEAVTAILGFMFAPGLLGATLLPFEIGKYFGWLFMPPLVLIVVVFGIVMLRCLFPGLR